jgi:hypothetical protein
MSMKGLGLRGRTIGRGTTRSSEQVGSTMCLVISLAHLRHARSSASYCWLLLISMGWVMSPLVVVGGAGSRNGYGSVVQNVPAHISDIAADPFCAVSCSNQSAVVSQDHLDVEAWQRAQRLWHLNGDEAPGLTI